MQRPKKVHWETALRVVHYLKGNPSQSILLCADCDLKLNAFCDSNWASCPLMGYFVSLRNYRISWKTKKQQTMSRSSTEAEYRSMTATVCELKWLKGLLDFLDSAHIVPMRLFCDNQYALHIAANLVYHERTKHIEVDCHFICDEIQNETIQMEHVRTFMQLADIFKKVLGNDQFDFLLRKLGIRDIHAPT